MNTIAIAYSHDVIQSGVLPDLEDPHDIAVDFAPVSQAPTTRANGFERRGRTFRASLGLKNLEMGARFYGPAFGIHGKRVEQFIKLLTDVHNALGDEASPDEVYVLMRDLLAGTSDIPETPLQLLTAAYEDFWSFQAEGGYIFDPEA